MISHHNQTFYESASELLLSERGRLSALVGQTIDQAWVACSSDGSWFTDEPAIIVAGGHQLEVAAYQVGLLAITWNTVDLFAPPNWLGCWDDSLDAIWTRATDPALVDAIGRRIDAIHVADHDPPDFPSGAHALQFQLDSGLLVLYNALDELGASDRPLVGAKYTLHAVAA